MKYLELDHHSGFPSNHRPRNFHNFDFLSEDCILIELGDGGDATKSPEKWAKKLTDQKYNIHFFLLDAPLDVLKERTAIRKDWNETLTFGAWNSYKYDPNFIDLPKKLGLTQSVIDTSKMTTHEAARTVLKSIELGEMSPC